MNEKNTNKTFSDRVICHASELDIIPKLLLIALGGSADWDGTRENAEKIDSIIAKYYFDSLSSDMLEAANNQAKNKRAKSSQTGAVAANFLRVNFNLKNLSVYKITEADLLLFVDDLGSVTGVDVLATKNVLKEIREIKTRFGIRPIVEIITELCPQLIEEVKVNSRLLSDLGKN